MMVSRRTVHMFILKSMELVTGKTTRSHILVLFILLYIKKSNTVYRNWVCTHWHRHSLAHSVHCLWRSVYSAKQPDQDWNPITAALQDPLRQPRGRAEDVQAWESLDTVQRKPSLWSPNKTTHKIRVKTAASYLAHCDPCSSHTPDGLSFTPWLHCMHTGITLTTARLLSHRQIDWGLATRALTRAAWRFWIHTQTLHMHVKETAT